MTTVKSNLPEFARDVDVASRYGVSRATVWRWTAEGRIPKPEKLAPGTTRWRLALVVDALEARA